MARTTPSTTPSLSSQMIAVTKNGYDPSKLYIESTDRNGHYERTQQIKIPPAVEVLIMQAVDGNPGYNKSSQAFIRDAIIHRLAWIDQNPGSNIDSLQLALEVNRNQMSAYLKLCEQITQDLKMFDQVMEQCEAAEDWSLMNMYIENLQATLDNEDLTISPGHREAMQVAVEDAMQAMTDANTKRKRRR